MTDRELLELAAKAAGIDLDEWSDYGYGFDTVQNPMSWWNPLTDDGDALRLAVKLKLTITQDGDWCDVIYNTDKTRCVATYLYKDADNDPYSATRRAIVRAAAEIGKTL